jgi:hypothetical protein
MTRTEMAEARKLETEILAEIHEEAADLQKENPSWEGAKCLREAISGRPSLYRRYQDARAWRYSGGHS